MIMNAVEMLLVNHPFRAMVQRWYEAPLFRKWAGRLDGRRVLEIGCGRGVGIEILLREFGAGQVCAIDLDPRQIRRARANLGGRASGRVVFAVANAERIPARTGYFDAVFSFGVLHHVEAWQIAIAEIGRVLKPGGLFLFGEATGEMLGRPFGNS